MSMQSAWAFGLSGLRRGCWTGGRARVKRISPSRAARTASSTCTAFGFGDTSRGLLSFASSNQYSRLSLIEQARSNRTPQRKNPMPKKTQRKVFTPALKKVQKDLLKYLEASATWSSRTTAIGAEATPLTRAPGIASSRVHHVPSQPRSCSSWEMKRQKSTRPATSSGMPGLTASQ